MGKIWIIGLMMLITLGAQAQKGPIDPVKASKELVVFPNPCQDYFQIDTELKNITQVKVIDFIGKEVKIFHFGVNQKMDLSDLRNGVYFIQILDSQNKLVATRRLKKV